jgi:hypothetical protein
MFPVGDRKEKLDGWEAQTNTRHPAQEAADEGSVHTELQSLVLWKTGTQVTTHCTQAVTSVINRAGNPQPS